MTMSETSSIEWTDATWNPVRGCSVTSPGCHNCYAPYAAVRLMGPGQAYDGLVERSADGRMRWTGAVRCVPEKLTEPLAWKKPKMIFVNSMSDLFHEDIPEDYIAEVCATMYEAQWHTFQVLTKRATRLRTVISRPSFWISVAEKSARRFAERRPRDAGMVTANDIWSDIRSQYPLPNIWWGVSVENRRHGLERAHELRYVPAAVRFLSVEPLLEDLGPIDLTGIDWIIVGGESGPGARPMHPSWPRAIRDQCQAAGVPFFFKQHGEWLAIDDWPLELSEKATSKKATSIRARSMLPDGRLEFTAADCRQLGTLPSTIARVGKRAAGRLLDGREWNEMPRRAVGVAR
jgi:protein gp37